MDRWAAKKPLRCLVAAWWLAASAAMPAGAQQAPLPESPAAGPSEVQSAAASTSADSVLAASREWLKSGDYDRAIESLRSALESGAHPPEVTRELYLQLIKAHVFLGNDLRFRPQGRESANLNYRAARELTAECLTSPVLRHTRPEPETDYPPEMVRIFSDVRAEMFGAFRVVSLEPAIATVTFDGAPMPSGADGRPGDDDLAVGNHRVKVEAKGYQTVEETIALSPSATLERSYRLEKARTTGWYVTRGAILAGAIIGAGLLISNGGSSDETPAASALPEAPPPPAR